MAWKEEMADRLKELKNEARVALAADIVAGLSSPKEYPYKARSRVARQTLSSEAQTNSSGYDDITFGGEAGGPATNAVSIYVPANNTVIQG